MSVKVYQADIDVPDDSPWAIIPNEWEDGEDNQLGYGPVKGSIDDAHAFAAKRIPGQGVPSDSDFGDKVRELAGLRAEIERARKTR